MNKTKVLIGVLVAAVTLSYGAVFHKGSKTVLNAKASPDVIVLVVRIIPADELFPAAACAQVQDPASLLGCYKLQWSFNGGTTYSDAVNGDGSKMRFCPTTNNFVTYCWGPPARLVKLVED